MVYLLTSHLKISYLLQKLNAIFSIVTFKKTHQTESILENAITRTVEYSNVIYRKLNIRERL